MDYCSCTDTLLDVEAYGSSAPAQNLVMLSGFVGVETALTWEIRCWNIARRLNVVFHLEYCEWQELLPLQLPLPRQFQYDGFGDESRWYGG